MKKLLSLLLCLVLTSALFGCNRGEADPTEIERIETTQATEPSVETTEATEATEETKSPVPEWMVCLDDVIAGSDILMTVDGNRIVLEEDGLVLELSTHWDLVHRDGYVVAAMRRAPMIWDGKVYVNERFCNDTLGVGELEKPTLFHQIRFYAGEILDAIDAPEASEFNRKLLQQVLLPTSMGIEAPHVDMLRYFHEDSLADYPDVLKAELASMGYGHAFLYVYGEYQVISDSKMMDRNFIKSVRESAPEFEDVPLESMTVGEYSKLRREMDQIIAYEEMTEEQRTFSEEKGITLGDIARLRKVFYSDYMNQSDDVLRAALEDYYQTDINYLKDAAGRE